MAKVSREIVEAIMKEPVHFAVRSGSNEGYTCDMITVDVWTKSSPTKPETILIKCYPTTPSRQDFLDQCNTFRLELGVYQEIIPKFTEFQEEISGWKFISPPVPKFLHGNYISPEERQKLERPMNPVENYIAMLDLREESNGAFRLRSPFEGFDYDHYILVMRAHATFHALSWAYKCKRGIRSLEVEFPFIKPKSEEVLITEEFTTSCYQNATEIVRDSPKASEAIRYLATVHDVVDRLYFKKKVDQTKSGHTKDQILKNPGRILDHEEPWEVLLHGDAWSNNMLFRYDPNTKRPAEVLLIDLQQTREGDPFCDLAYTMYCSGSTDVRRKHLSSLLRVYHDTFEDVCQTLDVPLLPGWSWEEVNRRFHRARIFGAHIAMIGVPFFLKNPEKISNLDNVAADIEKDSEESSTENFRKFFSDIWNASKGNPAVAERYTAVLEELHEDGIL